MTATVPEHVPEATLRDRTDELHALRKGVGQGPGEKATEADSQSIGADLTDAWPTNEIAVMGAEGAANVVFRRQIAEAENPEAMRARMVKEYKAELMHPYYAAERGLVDDVIDPTETREVLIRSLAMLHTKHADLPSRRSEEHTSELQSRET